MKEYVLRANHIGPQYIVSIDEERHVDLVKARQCLIDAGSFERRYEILLGNFLAFEDFCACSGLRSHVEMDHSYENGSTVILEANRHIMNFLTAGKTYSDQVKSDFKLFGKKRFTEQVVTLMDEASERSSEYRLVTALRNITQHQDMPVDGFEASRGRPDRVKGLVFWCYREKFRPRGRPGASNDKLVGVFEQAPEKTDLQIALRGYMHEIGKVHVRLRTFVQAACQESRAAIERARTDYMAAQNDPDANSIGLESICYEDSQERESALLMLDWDDTRVALASKNRYPVRFDDS